MNLDNVETEFKIDTGADVTVVPADMYSSERFHKLQKSNKILFGPGQTKLYVQGKITATLSKNGKSTTQDVYVVAGLKTPLLGRPAIKALGLVARVDTVILNDKETVKQEFPKLFNGLGKLEGEYEIVLEPDAKPFQFQHQDVYPFPSCPK